VSLYAPLILPLVWESQNMYNAKVGSRHTGGQSLWPCPMLGGNVSAIAGKIAQ